MKEYNICYSLDLKYIEQLCASIASILANSKHSEKLNFFILDGGLLSEDKSKIELLKNIKNFKVKYFQMNNKDFENCPLLCKTNENYKDYHVTIPTYYRFLLPDLLKNENKILYLDCDVIVKDSLEKLFSENIENKAALMVLDAASKKEAPRLNLEKYFNAGVMLINLDYWRKNNVSSRLFDYAKNNFDKILWQDQDIINSVLSDEIKEIPDIWNYQYFQYENINISNAAEAVILHFAGRFKPWLMPFESEIYEEYYEYLKLTPFKNKITQYKLNASGKRLKNNTGGSVTNIVLNATDEDINKCWSEISKSYSYTNEQTDLINKNFDLNISRIYDDIDKNYKYTDSLSNSINQNTDNKLNCLEQNFDNKLTMQKNNLEQNFNKKTEDLSSDITKETDLKFSEIYSYTNSHASKFYKEIKNASSNIENNLNNNIKEFYRLNNEINNKIDLLKKETENLVKNEKLDLFNENFNKIIEEKSIEYSLNIEKLKSDFEEKLNSQRIKYEKKLIEMENQLEKMNLKLKELKRSPVDKFFEKFRKKNNL